MHLNNYTNRHELLIDWILESTPTGASILDIGANDGSFCPEVSRIAAHAGLYAGVDPDTAKLATHPLVQQRFPSTLESADIHSSSFDCVFAIYVLEHVADDVAFLQTVSRVLKPGGSFYFITPNGDHYFAAIASTLARIGLQERVLRLIRPNELVGKYHYPALYRMNTAAKLRRMGKEMGLGSADFRYSERFDEFACYFPGPTKVFPWAWEQMVMKIGNDRLLGNLMGRMTKDPAPEAMAQ
jgi:ubiquinone/menaquinone biosynthesis C-methylase UbiE